MKYRKKPVVIEAITFDELVEYGKRHGANIVNNMPWSFQYNGHPITHENDKCYLIPTLEGTMKMLPDDMLIVGVKGEIYPCKKDIFEATYEKVEQPRHRREERIKMDINKLRSLISSYTHRLIGCDADKGHVDALVRDIVGLAATPAPVASVCKECIVRCCPNNPAPARDEKEG